MRDTLLNGLCTVEKRSMQLILETLMPPSTPQQNPEFELMLIEVAKGVLKYSAMLGDRSVPIWVEPETGEANQPSLLQREAIRQALLLPPDVLRITAPIVMQNYEVYREMVGDEEMPPLSDPLQVWERVTFSHLFVPPHRDYDLEISSFMLRAECSWDLEHGLEVRFRNGVADAASQQGDLGW